MHKEYKIIVDREDLTISYCDPITLETIEVKRFKTVEDLEKYIQNKN